MAVLAANKSKEEAVTTTANFSGTPPEMAASSEMNRSLCVALTSEGRRVMERVVRIGEVKTIVPTMAAMANRVVLRIGKRIVAPGNFDILQRKKDEAPCGQKNEKRGAILNVPVEDSRNVINRGADIAENDGPR